MVKVFSPGQSHGRWATCLSVCLALVLTFALLAPGRVPAQPPSSTTPAPPERGEAGHWQRWASHGQSQR